MGGATEEDEAMKWFLNRANGGDVLVLRASGSDGYNDYFYTQLGVPVNSVETIVFNDASASAETYIHQKITQAEAIWFAGGDQWDYISYWRNTPIDSLINLGIVQRNIVVGGTSAGMAIQGGFYFSAENSTVTSAEALADPFDTNVTVDSASFLANAILADVITDTHYDNPDRKGRHVAFLARIWEDYGTSGKGIACDEYTAVCIDENNIARIYGQHPTYDDNAYFLQVNCEIINPTPEVCAPGTSLTWNHNGAAISVYAVKGTLAGTNTFDLNDWQTGTGGEWQQWSVVNGVLNEAQGSAPNCVANLSGAMQATPFDVFLDPVENTLTVNYPGNIHSLVLLDLEGKVVRQSRFVPSLSTQGLATGLYTLQLTNGANIKRYTKVMVP